MKASKNLILVMASLSLVACSAMDEKNTFMTYGDLQDKVREHDEQWAIAQAKLERLDELEAEVAALKQGQPVASAPMNDNMTGINVAPVIAPTTFDSPAQTTNASMVTAPMVMEPSSMDEPVMAEPVSQAPVVAYSPAPEESPYGVQLASYANRDEAARGWRVLQSNYPNSFDGLLPLINQKQVNGRTMYQLKVGPFVSKAYSGNFCQMLKDRGSDCLVTRYNGETL
ncbi:SPOR domain-containing protein [Marinomonas sp. A79]|uniref:SPOR domain-containing protein n=1 Tax=Marinomonas vulgaris TaxID=2823372 RepID=A0ABS5HDW0_9GAMM|nr:SPOR domain-containing protein [Marinomonas vulgaris]MBR7889827.1 SPOR domain-containing protein [Marinomonas vulgaris]